MSHFKKILVASALLSSGLSLQISHAQVTSNFDNLPATTKPLAKKKTSPTAGTYHRPVVNLPKGTDSKTFADTPLPPVKAPVLPALEPMWMPETTHPDIPAQQVAPDSGASTPILKLQPSGYKICFAPQKYTLGTDAYNFLVNLGKQLSQDPAARVIIQSYATGAQDDPSLPRRMAFARALLARSVFINQNVPATRIYPQALGIEATVTNCPNRIEIHEEHDAPNNNHVADNITALIHPSPAQQQANKNPAPMAADPALTPNANPFKAN